jgi:hypothetical protein
MVVVLSDLARAQDRSTTPLSIGPLTPDIKDQLDAGWTAGSAVASNISPYWPERPAMDAAIDNSKKMADAKPPKIGPSTDPRVTGGQAATDSEGQNGGNHESTSGVGEGNEKTALGNKLVGPQGCDPTVLGAKLIHEGLRTKQEISMPVDGVWVPAKRCKWILNEMWIHWVDIVYYNEVIRQMEATGVPTGNAVKIRKQYIEKFESLRLQYLQWACD